MKAVLISIQPYWVFLIIARKMGWDIGKEKTIEVRKNFPKDESWNRKAEIYCSKDKKSFNLIPKEYQPLMEKFLGKVIGSFTCKEIEPLTDYDLLYCRVEEYSCVDIDELLRYKGKNDFLYGWHISHLKIYGKPRELSEFYTWKKCNSCRETGYESTACCFDIDCKVPAVITRPPQSWCYVEVQNVQNDKDLL